jgi:AcrR family transcriptional regulator
VSERTGQIVDAARALIDEGGSAALTMRALGERLGIRAPSLYKHFPDKGAVEAQVITLAMRELVTALARADSLVELAATYRAYALAHPHLYRLMNSGPLPRHLLPPGVEEATALPLVRAVGGETDRRALSGRSRTAWSSWSSTGVSRPTRTSTAPGAPGWQRLPILLDAAERVSGARRTSG